MTTMARALVAVAGLAVLPLAVGEDYYINLLSQIVIAALIASSLNILVGYAGLTSLGHAAYPGIAAYAVAWLTQAGAGHAEAMVLALGLVFVTAAFFGLLALRASGLGFLMITLALGQILWGIAYRFVSFTGGDNGISGITRPAVPGIDLGSPLAFYYLTLAIGLPAIAGIAVFVRSPFGAGLQGTRDQPRRMRALGYNVWLIQYLAFIASGLLGGIGGILYVYYHQYISPHYLSLTNSAEYLLMVIAGGTGTVLGPVVGAALVVIAKNVVSAYVARWLMLLGIVFVLIVVFMPEGLVPGVRKLFRRRAGTQAGKGESGARATTPSALQGVRR